jgi:ABC-2 type transport system ATP-binding protein
MIRCEQVSKNFGSARVVDNVSMEIHEGDFFALIGTNGAGKSTLFRMITGILRPDEGTITIDGETVYDNVKAKQNFFFIPDDPYFFANSNCVEMAKYFRSIYPNYDMEYFKSNIEKFGLDPAAKIKTFSKGMKKQAIILLGLAAKTKYLLCDETFDGLDPVMRQSVKSLFVKEMEEREFTPIVASHNLREMEDICDHVGLLHRGGVLFTKDLEDMKCNIQKVQCVLQRPEDEAEISQALDVMKVEKRGSLRLFTIRGTREDVATRFETLKPVFYEVLPLSLEEIFISETEVVGYDVKNLILE